MWHKSLPAAYARFMPAWRRTCGSVLLGLLCVWGAVFCTSRVMAATPDLRLTLAIPYGTEHPVYQQVLSPWAQSIYEQSKGAIRIDIFGANALLIEADAYAPLVTGALNIGGILPTNMFPTPPVSGLLNYYLDAPNAYAASRMVWDTLQYHKALQAELQLVHLLWAWASSPTYIHTISKPIRTVADMQDVKLLVWSNMMETFVATMGGIPLRCLPAETATLLRKGLAEGVLCPTTPLFSFDIEQHVQFTTNLPLEYLSFYMGMNKEIWNALPPHHKKLFNDTTGRAISGRCGLVLDAAEHVGRRKLLAQGHTFINTDEAFQLECRKHMALIRQKQANTVKALNIPGMAEFSTLIQEIRTDIKREDSGR